MKSALNQNNIDLHLLPDLLWKLSSNKEYKKLLKNEDYNSFLQIVSSYKQEVETFIETNKLSKKLLEKGTIR